tara:strand:+ start:173 stop:1159 length:987 start_codon:yes stop_codon:yes gene_type:complete
MIRWGIVGLGNMAHRFANSIQETNNAKLIGVASLNENRLKLFKENFNLTKENTYNEYENLISSKNIDAIYISTLNNTHLEMIKKSSEHKKNILCEKPMAINYDETKIASKYIKKNDIGFYEAIAYRTHVQTKIIKDIIDQNEIGNVISVDANFGFKVNKVKPESRLFNKELGGGSILDIGCYPMSFLNFLFDEKNDYKIISSKGSFASTNVDDSAELEILINNKVSCNLKISIKENLSNKIVIKGTKGELLVNNPWLPEKKSTLDVRTGSSFYKKFVNSDLTIYANQIQKISENFEKKINSDKFAVDIFDSLHISKNLTLWSNLIKNN